MRRIARFCVELDEMRQVREGTRKKVTTRTIPRAITPNRLLPRRAPPKRSEA